MPKDLNSRAVWGAGGKRVNCGEVYAHETYMHNGAGQRAVESHRGVPVDPGGDLLSYITVE